MRGLYLHKFPKDLGSPNPFLPGRKLAPGYLRNPDDFSLSLNDIQYEDNKTGWAWWAGTSFATPIITGLLARFWVPSGSDVQAILNMLSGGAITSQQERVISVNQV